MNTVAPGLIETESTPAHEPVTAAHVDAPPMRRLGELAEAAHVATILVDERSGFITGQTIFVDGGRSIAAASI